RPETRERILTAARELGYRPNAAARSLRTARTGTLGLFLPDFTNPVYAQVITGAEAGASAHGAVLLTASSNVVGRDTRTYVELLGNGRVDGLLLAGDALTAGRQATLDSLGLPYLWVNRRMAGSHRSVVLDDGRAARIAVEHLAGLGHSRIAHLAGPPRADTARRRRSGYSAALKAVGLPREDSLIASADYTPHGGAAALITLMHSPDPPTAVVVANVASAIGALSSARRNG
ncbi:MAG: LacI family DNA-binding transcriptional regulator, partial [Mycobacterium sp.]|nr:LacI family DNA-binding transcriptional regulator [Mycobacterium sp.]